MFDYTDSKRFYKRKKHFFYRYCLSTLLLTLATSPQAADDKANATANQPPAIASKMEWAEITNTLRDNSDQIWLTPAAQEPYKSDSFLLLMKASEADFNKGTLLLLPDNNQHANWPGLQRHLRTQLPLRGWTTLAISLPPLNIENETHSTTKTITSQKPALQTPADSESAKKKDEKASPSAPSGELTKPNAGLVDFIKQSRLRFERTQEHMQQQKLTGKLIMVAIGSSASALLGAIQQGYQTSHVDGLVLIDAHQRIVSADLDIAAELVKLGNKIPILDIFQTTMSYSAQIQKRQQLAQQQQTQYYSADPLPATFRRIDLRFSEPELIFIEKRLVTWLQSEFYPQQPKPNKPK